MRQAWLTLVTCLLIPLVSVAQPSADTSPKPVMRWLVTDYPPAFILVNGQPTEGFFDGMLLALAQRWPEVSHQYDLTNPSRGFREVANGNPACYVGALQTPERERQALLIPTHMIYPIHLVVTNDAWPRVPRNANGEVLLGKLLEQSDLRGILVRGRSYSVDIDAILAPHSKSESLQYVVRADGGGNVFRMMAQGRADYTLEYPAVMTYQRQRNPSYFEGRPMSAQPLEGGKPLLTGILCPRTPWGSRTAHRVDALIAAMAGERAYLKDASRWIPPEASGHYQKDIDAFYRQRAKTAPAGRYALP